ncbi:MAG: formyltetrahydrofolate deformylase [Verrucomicrobia bacterium]|jgi:formyltetrahydrofolate deformylase|nr:formyltetrahydrofolate deformylase [Verrucomicrobiota bacterium]
MLSIVALLHGPDRPGLVATVAGWIFKRGGNILHADQHRDSEEQIFFQRIEWLHPVDDSEIPAVAEAFSKMATHELGMHCHVSVSSELGRVGVLVSKMPHCLRDLAFRFQQDELRGEIGCVISNHRDVEPFCRSLHLPFYYIPIDASLKADAENAQLKILKGHGVNLVVLARYMQVLSGEFIDSIEVPIINIHHSFLPAFAGGRPYHQAYARGVKIIGATAHYVTAELDQGPIIAQDVARVSHRHSVEDLIRKGRDLEELVLAQAVRWHLEHRVLVYGNKTVVFD